MKREAEIKEREAKIKEREAKIKEQVEKRIKAEEDLRVRETQLEVAFRENLTLVENIRESENTTTVLANEGNNNQL